MSLIKRTSLNPVHHNKSALSSCWSTAAAVLCGGSTVRLPAASCLTAPVSHTHSQKPVRGWRGWRSPGLVCYRHECFSTCSSLLNTASLLLFLLLFFRTAAARNWKKTPTWRLHKPLSSCSPLFGDVFWQITSLKRLGRNRSWSRSPSRRGLQLWCEAGVGSVTPLPQY